MSSPKNQAAWLDGQGKQLRVAEADIPTAGEDDLIIRNYAVAVNPVDWKIQDSGHFIKQWPNVLGCDVAGEVYAVGAKVGSRFKKGDRVTSHAAGLLSSDPSEGGFQIYTKATPKFTAILPKDTSYVEGSVLPLAVDTALVGLCSPTPNGLGLPFPSLDPKSSPSGKTIVVWGGSSSVGALCIQLASASGTKVITVASSHNFDLCKRCGATEVFDYKKDSVINDVVAAVKRAGGDFAGVYDAISVPDQSYKYTLPILEQLSGGVLACVLGPPEEVSTNINVARVFGINPMTEPVWESYITQALEQGKLLCVPEPLVVGKGLETIQKGLDANKQGVSAAKVVIEL